MSSNRIYLMTGPELATAMLTLRRAGHDEAANVFQDELVRRVYEDDRQSRIRHHEIIEAAWQEALAINSGRA